MDNSIIKSLEIKNLWSRVSGKIPFNDDVNIIIGKNGTGKSTVLDLIMAVLSRHNSREINIDESILTFKDGNKIEFKRVKNGIGEFPLDLKAENIDDLLSILKKNILKQINKEQGLNELEINKKNDDLGKIVEEEEEGSFPAIDIIKISTFDMELKNRILNTNEDKKFIRTELDVILYKLIEKFKLYQYQLKAKLEEESEKIDLSIKLLDSKSEKASKRNSILSK
ncbi:hypothetical protein CPG38_13890, partial [Malaciobacter marinus]|uniref:AAA family ATPase n=1 Tax=Malaciobacter marinus TaxID=505249 RepID=UPI000C0A601A